MDQFLPYRYLALQAILLQHVRKWNTAMGIHKDVNTHTHTAEKKWWCRCRDEVVCSNPMPLLTYDSVHTETHLKCSTQTAEQHSSCIQGWACCSQSVLMFVRVVMCAQALLPIAQSDNNQQHTPWQSVNWYLGADYVTHSNINGDADVIQVKFSCHRMEFKCILFWDRILVPLKVTTPAAATVQIN